MGIQVGYYILVVHVSEVPDLYPEFSGFDTHTVVKYFLIDSQTGLCVKPDLRMIETLATLGNKLGLSKAEKLFLWEAKKRIEGTWKEPWERE